MLHNTFPSAKVFSFYIFTMLMFRKVNKTTIKQKIKRLIFIGRRPFDSRLYLDISCSPMVYLICNYLVVLCVARIYFKSSRTREF